MDKNQKDKTEFKGRSNFFWKVFQKDDDNKIFSKENVLYFVELCKFAAQLETLDLTDEKNLWLFMLTHVADVSEELLERSDPIFRCFHQECLVSNLNDMEKKEYVTSVLEYDDVRESMMCEREVGREEGIEQGREEKTRLLVRNMLAEGLDPAMVAKIAELTEGEVLAMREEM
jgi:predicted transposase/invertase (TIGR01784 family)